MRKQWKVSKPWFSILVDLRTPRDPHFWSFPQHSMYVKILSGLQHWPNDFRVSSDNACSFLDVGKYTLVLCEGPKREELVIFF